MQLTSPAFQNNQLLPKNYSCDGVGVNPPLTFSGVPQEAKSLALIVDDPDAPMGTFVHWVLYNIPVSTTEIGENAVPAGCVQGKSTRGVGFVPACPPDGQHRYFFKLYALETVLPDGSLDKAGLENAMKNHVLATSELVGLYKRP